MEARHDRRRTDAADGEGERLDHVLVERCHSHHDPQMAAAMNDAMQLMQFPPPPLGFYEVGMLFWFAVAFCVFCLGLYLLSLAMKKRLEK